MAVYSGYSCTAMTVRINYKDQRNSKCEMYIRQRSKIDREMHEKR